MKYNLFLDDDPKRIPNELSWIKLPVVDWTIVRSYKAFVECVTKNGCPTICSFDHDLGDEHYQEFHAMREERRPIDYSRFKEKTGRDCAVWLANYCIDTGTPIPLYYVHSMNGPGGENIISIMESAKKAILQKYKNKNIIT